MILKKSTPDYRKITYISLAILISIILFETMEIAFSVNIPYKLKLTVFYLIFMIVLKLPNSLDFLIGLLFTLLLFPFLIFQSRPVSDQLAGMAYLFFIIGALRYFLRELLEERRFLFRSAGSLIHSLKVTDSGVRTKAAIAIGFTTIIYLIIYFSPMLVRPSTTIFGKPDDVLDLIWGGWALKEFGEGRTEFYAYPEGRLLTTSATQWLWTVYLNLSIHLGEILSYNILFILGYFLTGLFSVLLFSKLLKDWLSAMIVSSLFLLLPYHYYQSLVHLDLAQIWLVPLFFYAALMLYEQTNIKSTVLFQLTVITVIFTVNYYGFFSLLVFQLLFIGRLLIGLFYKQKLRIQKLFRSLIAGNVCFVIAILILSPVFRNLIKANFLNSPVNQADVQVRGVEDFINFTARPWNFIIPTEDHILLGTLSEKFYAYLKNGWGYFLADDYNINEHGGLYFGIVNLFFVTIFLVYKLYKREFNDKIAFYLLLVFLVLIFTAPPFFTAFGFKFYTPTYLIAEFASVFRVMARLTVFALFPFFILIGFGLNELKRSRLGILVSVSYFLFSFIDFHLPARFISDSSIPEVYSSLSYPEFGDSVLAIYPYKETDNALYWQRKHRRPVINPRGYVSETLNSQDFTNNLVTEQGLNSAKERGATHLVVYERKAEESAFFIESPRLTLIDDYERYLLFKIN